MRWEQMTWPELAAVDRDTVVVLPLGSCEQHGMHLPIGTDAIQVESIAAAAERERAATLLLAPTLWLGCSHHHRDFGGMLSLRPSLYARVIQELVACVLESGFRRVLLLNGHGGNDAPASEALSELVATDDRADEAWLALSNWWSIAQRSLADPSLGMSGPPIDHADEYETSLILFLRPELVHPERIVETPPLLDSGWICGNAGGRVQVFKRFSRLTASGSYGKPSAATAEKGKGIHQAVVRDVLRLTDEMRQWPILPVRGGRDAKG